MSAARAWELRARWCSCGWCGPPVRSGSFSEAALRGSALMGLRVSFLPLERPVCDSGMDRSRGRPLLSGSSGHRGLFHAGHPCPHTLPVPRNRNSSRQSPGQGSVRGRDGAKLMAVGMQLLPVCPLVLNSSSSRFPFSLAVFLSHETFIFSLLFHWALSSSLSH